MELKPLSISIRHPACHEHAEPYSADGVNNGDRTGEATSVTPSNHNVCTEPFPRNESRAKIVKGIHQIVSVVIFVTAAGIGSLQQGQALDTHRQRRSNTSAMAEEYLPQTVPRREFERLNLVCEALYCVSRVLHIRPWAKGLRIPTTPRVRSKLGHSIERRDDSIRTSSIEYLVRNLPAVLPGRDSSAIFL